MQWIIPFWYFRNYYNKITIDSITVAWAVAKWLWVVLRTTGCWQTSMLTQKVDSPWTKMKTTVVGWNSGIRVGRNRCLVLLLCAGRPVLPMAATLAKTGKNLWIANTCALIRNCWSKLFHNTKEERIFQLTFHWDCEGLWWTMICIHRSETILPWSILPPPCSGCMIQQG